MNNTSCSSNKGLRSTLSRSLVISFDLFKFSDILNRNFEGSEVTAIGINEVQLPGGQWGTDLTNDLSNCWVFFEVIKMGK